MPRVVFHFGSSQNDSLLSNWRSLLVIATYKLFRWRQLSLSGASTYTAALTPIASNWPDRRAHCWHQCSNSAHRFQAPQERKSIRGLFHLAEHDELLDKISRKQRKTVPPKRAQHHWSTTNCLPFGWSSLFPFWCTLWPSSCIKHNSCTYIGQPVLPHLSLFSLTQLLFWL